MVTPRHMQNKTLRLTSLAAFVVMCFVGAAVAELPLGLGRLGFSGNHKQITWQNDLKTAYSLSNQQKKPMLITFGASWCTYCKKLEKTTLSEEDMVRYIEANFIPVHLDFDKNREVAKVLEVETLPTIIVLSPEADLLGKIVGFKKADSLKDELEKSAQNKAFAQR